MGQINTDAIMAAYPDISADMAACLAVTRKIGADPELVLHGGGNTSFKTTVNDIFEETVDTLYVKASGADMTHIEPSEFTGLRLRPLQRLRALERLDDHEMVNQLALNRLEADSPAPSVEALLHAFLPSKFIVHSHADAILGVTNRADGRDLIFRVLGKDVVVLAYEKSGLPLAKKAAEAWERQKTADTLIILQHGIFTMADTAFEAYERMEACVRQADSWLRQHQPAMGGDTGSVCDQSTRARVIQMIRGGCLPTEDNDKKRPFLAEARTGSDMAAASRCREARAICESGVLTPDHAIRTKNRYVYLDHIPDSDEDLAALIREEVDRYQADYRQYFNTHAGRPAPAMLDPLPRIFLIAGMGMVALGKTPKEARVAADIAEHTVLTKRRCGADNYQPIAENHVFDMEYWPLQLQKLRPDRRQPLAGKVAVVTGAAGAIGCGIADRLMAAGAVVAVADIDQAGLTKVCELLRKKHGRDKTVPILFDVSDYGATAGALEQVVLTCGGLDILVPNAGTAYVAKLEDIDPDKFQRVISVNLMGCFNLIKAAVPVFRRQAIGGDIVVISSKNVFDPGAAFGAYSASKAAAHQIGRIAALELAELGVRTNLVNPDAVFGDEAVPSKLWETIGPDRMKARGLDPEGLKEYYRQRNLLKKSVTAEHVGNAVVFFASGLTPTTGATLPVDGGVAAAFPR